MGKRAHNLRFKNLIAPSRHSGLSSLSPNEPSSSLTMISPGSGTCIMRISPYTSSTLSRHSFCFRPCSLRGHSQWTDQHPVACITRVRSMDKCLRDECAWVLLECVNEDVSFRAFDGGKTSSDDASSPSTCDVEHTETRVNRGVNAQSLSTHILSASGQSSRAWKTAFRQQKIPEINTTRLQKWMGRRTYLLVFLILYWILLEGLISDALQIIHEGL